MLCSRGVETLEGDSHSLPTSVSRRESGRGSSDDLLEPLHPPRKTPQRDLSQTSHLTRVSFPLYTVFTLVLSVTSFSSTSVSGLNPSWALD